jgi:hypothetical protein
VDAVGSVGTQIVGQRRNVDLRRQLITDGSRGETN